MMMSSLDINTPIGRLSVADEYKAVELFEATYPSFKYLFTDNTSAARIDAVLEENGERKALVLTSCRRNFSLEMFRSRMNWEWLVTKDKLDEASHLCELERLALVGFLYIVPDRVLLTEQLYDSSLTHLPKEKRWLVPIRYKQTWTQATCNGGQVRRENAFITMNRADFIRR